MPSSLPASTCVTPRALRMLSILWTSFALTKCSSAFGKPRSLKTFPLPTSNFFFMFLAPVLGDFCSFAQPLFDQFHLPFRCDPACPRFLLEYVEHIDAVCEADGVDGSKCVTTV